MTFFYCLLFGLFVVFVRQVKGTYIVSRKPEGESNALAVSEAMLLSVLNTLSNLSLSLLSPSCYPSFARHQIFSCKCFHKHAEFIHIV